MIKYSKLKVQLSFFSFFFIKTLQVQRSAESAAENIKKKKKKKSFLSNFKAVQQWNKSLGTRCQNSSQGSKRSKIVFLSLNLTRRRTDQGGSGSASWLLRLWTHWPLNSKTNLYSNPITCWREDIVLTWLLITLLEWHACKKWFAASPCTADHFRFTV